ncbi:hypothetical protein B296_00038826 [Ensete ventricosum]|uniref:Bifunctional inhibitor/plant lipid transfer protein/seed storage helical domain-containing protein n=1 Tax=Ensete ventricosum TaxID=4639 RepID=A0A426ZGB2_ENSVE|nr:hypothetical protein B296_00038826 [Ensete ventricosum]
MASKASASVALFLTLNLLFFALSSACGTGCPKPTPSHSHGKCPVDALKLSACANLLNGLIKVGLGKFPKQPCECCTLLDGLVDLDAAVCLCTGLKANVLGVHLNLPINLSLLLNYCGKKAPAAFQCP